MEKGTKKSKKPSDETEKEAAVAASTVVDGADTATELEQDSKAEKESEPEQSAGQIKPNRHKFYLAAAIIAVIVIIGGWFVCSIFFASITLGSAHISARSSNAVLTDALHTQTTDYKLTIAYPDGKSRQFSLAQMGLSVNDTASVQSIRAQQHQFAHRLEWWRPVKTSVRLQKNPSTFNNFIARNVDMTVQPSKDAKLTIIKGQITLTNATTGKQYGLKNPSQTLMGMASSLQSKTIKLQTLNVDPALTTSLLAPDKVLLERIISQPASFTIGDKTIKTSPTHIADWLDITPNDKTKKVSITVNSGEIASYISTIASDSIRPPRDQMEVTLPNGSVQVVAQGVDGVDVVNQAGVATKVAKELLSGKGFAISLPVGSDDYQTVKTGYYPKWIEVDLTNKVLYAYQYTTLVKTYLVSAGAPATPTVTGQFKIYSKYLQQNMSGENADGTSYFQPNVPWVNYFYSDFAIHGNYWRPVSYFGHVNSSHGCVGLLDNDAEWIYNWAPIGTPVVIHT